MKKISDEAGFPGFEHIVATGYGYMSHDGPSFRYVHGYTRTSQGTLQFAEWRFWYEEDGTIRGAW